MTCLAECGTRRHEGPRDLIAILDTAERRPRDATFEVRPVEIEGQRRSAIAVPIASRIKWPLKLWEHSRLILWLGVQATCQRLSQPVDFRVGISDGRTYDQLLVRPVAPGDAPSIVWHPDTVDLSGYGGFQWSLFYRPSEIAWTLIFNTRPVGMAPPHCDTQPFWGAPTIESSR